MHPNALLEVKQVINETDLSQLPINTLELMDATDPLEVDMLLEQINGPDH
jgi:phosphotransferase system enzyme I (PtsI)